MATFTVTVADTTIADGLAAAERINNRLPEAERQKVLTFGDIEATEIVYQWLHSLIINDLRQAAQIAADTAIRAKSAELAFARAAPPAPSPPPPPAPGRLPLTPPPPAE